MLVARLGDAVKDIASVTTPLSGTLAGEVKPLTVMPVGGVTVRVTGPVAALPTEAMFRFAEIVPPGTVDGEIGSIVKSRVGIGGALNEGAVEAFTLELVALLTFTV